MLVHANDVFYVVGAFAPCPLLARMYCASASIVVISGGGSRIRREIESLLFKDFGKIYGVNLLKMCLFGLKFAIFGTM